MKNLGLETRSGIRKKSIPDPGTKRHQIPDPRSGSATLIVTYKYRNFSKEKKKCFSTVPDQHKLLFWWKIFYFLCFLHLIVVSTLVLFSVVLLRRLCLMLPGEGSRRQEAVLRGRVFPARASPRPNRLLKKLIKTTAMAHQVGNLQYYPEQCSALISMRIRIQHFFVNADQDPGLRWPKIGKNLQL